MVVGFGIVGLAILFLDPDHGGLLALLGVIVLVAFGGIILLATPSFETLAKLRGDDDRITTLGLADHETPAAEKPA